MICPKINVSYVIQDLLITVVSKCWNSQIVIVTLYIFTKHRCKWKPIFNSYHFGTYAWKHWKDFKFFYNQTVQKRLEKVFEDNCIRTPIRHKSCMYGNSTKPDPASSTSVALSLPQIYKCMGKHKVNFKPRDSTLCFTKGPKDSISQKSFFKRCSQTEFTYSHSAWF